MLQLNNVDMLALLKDFHYLTGAKICIFDTNFQEIVFYPEKRCEFCSMVRSNPEASQLCQQSDKNAFLHCQNTCKPYLYSCHMNLTEYVSPLIYDGIIIGFVMTGQLSDSMSGKFTEIVPKLKGYGFDVGHAAELYFRIPYMEPERIAAATRIVDACASYIYQKKLIEIQSLDLAAQIEKYIAENLPWDLTVSRLCGQFSIPRVELYRLFEKRFGMSVADFVRTRRMEKAKELIGDTDDRITDIASGIGFGDYNYFSKVFKSAYGCSPREYREKTRLWHERMVSGE